MSLYKRISTCCQREMIASEGYIWCSKCQHHETMDAPLTIVDPFENHEATRAALHIVTRERDRLKAGEQNGQIPAEIKEASVSKAVSTEQELRDLLLIERQRYDATKARLSALTSERDELKKKVERTIEREAAEIKGRIWHTSTDHLTRFE